MSHRFLSEPFLENSAGFTSTCIPSLPSSPHLHAGPPPPFVASFQPIPTCSLGIVSYDNVMEPCPCFQASCAFLSQPEQNPSLVSWTWSNSWTLLTQSHYFLCHGFPCTVTFLVFLGNPKPISTSGPLHLLPLYLGARIARLARLVLSCYLDFSSSVSSSYQSPLNPCNGFHPPHAVSRLCPIRSRYHYYIGRYAPLPLERAHQ